MNVLKTTGIKIEFYLFRVSLRNDEKINQMIEAIKKADLIVLATPLYFDCSPYITIQAMEIIAKRGLNSKNNDKKFFFPILNSGLPEQNHFSVALRIYKKFAKDTGFEWSGSLCVGTGQGLSGEEGTPLEEAGMMGKMLLTSLEKIGRSLAEGKTIQDEFVGVVPKTFLKGFLKWLGWIIFKQVYRKWKKNAKKLGENVKARPYVQ